MNSGAEFELRQYLEVLWRRKWVIVPAALVTLALAVALALTSTSVYAASAEVLVTSPGQEAVFGSGSGGQGDPARTVQTQIQVLESGPIAIEAHRRLQARARLVGAVRVAAVGQTDVIRITVESTVPAVARDAANAYATVYSETRRQQAVASTLAVATELQDKLVPMKTQLNDLESRIAQSLAARESDLGAIENLRTQRDAVAAQYALFKQKYDQTQVDAALVTGGAQVIAEASLPGVPIRPRPVRDGVLALVLGVLLGLGCAFVIEHLDDTIKSPDDLARYAKGMSFLGTIPKASRGRKRDPIGVVALEKPGSSVAEAYRALRTSVQIVGLHQSVRTLLVTSSASSEGKTTTVANLGVTMALLGRRVVLVDLDLRRPCLAEYFGLRNELGFMSVLLGDAPLSEALQEVPILLTGSLRVLASGPLTPNPSEVPNTQRVNELLDSLRAGADVVIIDSPPLLPVTDALVLSHRVDGVMLIAQPGRTRRDHLARVTQMLREADAPVIGVVLNGSTVAEGNGYGYGYGYGYYGEHTQKSRRRARRRENRRQDQTLRQIGA